MSTPIDGEGGDSVNQMTLSLFLGDGVTSTRIGVSVELPDSDGGTVAVNGHFRQPGGADVSCTGTVTAPSAPGSGVLYWLIQTDSAGVLSLKQSSSSMPSPDAGRVPLFRQALPAGAGSCANAGSA